MITSNVSFTKIEVIQNWSRDNTSDITSKIQRLITKYETNGYEFHDVKPIDPTRLIVIFKTRPNVQQVEEKSKEDEEEDNKE